MKPIWQNKYKKNQVVIIRIERKKSKGVRAGDRTGHSMVRLNNFEKGWIVGLHEEKLLEGLTNSYVL